MDIVVSEGGDSDCECLSEAYAFVSSVVWTDDGELKRICDGEDLPSEAFKVLVLS